MRKITCIVCPKGCELQAELQGDTCIVTGNSCNRGREFAEAEMLHPMRTVQTTVKTTFYELPMVPVKTDGAVPKESIFMIINAAADIVINSIMKNGEIIIENVSGTGVNLVLTSDMSLYL